MDLNDYCREITTSCKYVLYINDFLINNWCGMVMYSLR